MTSVRFHGDNVPEFENFTISFDNALNATFSWKYYDGETQTVVCPYYLSINNDSYYVGHFLLNFSYDSDVSPNGFQFGKLGGQWYVSTDFSSINYKYARYANTIAVYEDGSTELIKIDADDKAEFILVDN